MWICNIIGHKFKKHGEAAEKPYTGNHRVNELKPHTMWLSLIYCERCAKMDTLYNYFFSEKEPT